MKELNITEGKWKWVDIPAKGMNQRKGLVAERRTQGESVLFHSARFQVSPSDAQAIVTAVNNTYHKGIDPEGVPDMKEALINARKELITAYKIIGNSCIKDSQLEVEDALQKAGATINEKAE